MRRDGYVICLRHPFDIGVLRLSGDNHDVPLSGISNRSREQRQRLKSFRNYAFVEPVDASISVRLLGRTGCRSEGGKGDYQCFSGIQIDNRLHGVHAPGRAIVLSVPWSFAKPPPGIRHPGHLLIARQLTPSKISENRQGIPTQGRLILCARVLAHSGFVARAGGIVMARYPNKLEHPALLSCKRTHCPS